MTGHRWEIEGVGRHANRTARVVHYTGGWEVHLTVDRGHGGPKGKAAITLDVQAARELAAALDAASDAAVDAMDRPEAA